MERNERKKWKKWPWETCNVFEKVGLGEGIVIEVVDEECVNGMPHTTDSSTIRMTKTDLNSRNFERIVSHERIHLNQKGPDRSRWVDFYKDDWGYEILTDVPVDSNIPSHLINKLRPNPDTVDSPFALWKGRYLFFPVSKSADEFRNARIVVWDVLKKKEIPIPHEWRRNFCFGSRFNHCPAQFEHPHEISAEFLSQPQLLGFGSRRSLAAQKLFSWHRKQPGLRSQDRK